MRVGSTCRAVDRGGGAPTHVGMRYGKKNRQAFKDEMSTMHFLILALLMDSSSLGTHAARQRLHRSIMSNTRTATDQLAALHPPAGCKKLIWITILGAEGGEKVDYYRYMQAALVSAREHAPSLIPYLIFDGVPNEYTAWFERYGGTVVMHQLSFADKLKQAVDAGWKDKFWFDTRGDFLKFDMPFVFEDIVQAHAQDPEVEKEYFFFTDIDVMFLKDVHGCHFKPTPYFSFGPQQDPGTPTNAGVMYVNAAGFRTLRQPLIEYGVSHRWNFTSPHDQALVRSFMNEHRHPIDLLPDALNWKGYWGYNESAILVHFHGPKVEQCLLCMIANGPTAAQVCKPPEHDCRPGYIPLWDMALQRDGGLYFRQLVQAYYIALSVAEHSR